MSAAVIAVPEQGQLVEVRRRRFVVTEVRASGLPPDAVSTAPRAPQHLVTLSSVEDDGLGEELAVVWEIEPGAKVYERAALPAPTAFDPPDRLDAFLDAVNWGAIASAETRALQAPFRSGIEIEDYQLDPVVRAIQMPRANLLIADDVGLGKTIEAGLVAQELTLRHRARTILIVCPSSIQLQWRDQMRDKFGLDFRIVDSALMRELRRRRGLHVNPWTHFPRLITSIDFLKRERPLRLFREVLPGPNDPVYPRRFDLLIVDEAHNVAPSGRGRYATDSQRTAAVQTLTPHFEHKLFLTATPHNGYPESFTALLELLDDQRFARGVSPDPTQLAAVMVRRLKRDLPPAWDGTPRFPVRKLEALEVDYPEAERKAHEMLRAYSAARTKGARDGTEAMAAEFVLKLLKKRLFSSPAAFASTLAQHERSLLRPRTARSAPRPTMGVLRRQLEEVEEEFDDDEAYEDASEEAVDVAAHCLRELAPEERELLSSMRAWATKASERPDAKARELVRWLRATVQPGGAWGKDRVIVFTEYRATQKWLHGLLAAEGLAGEERLMLLHGGMQPDERERIKAAFQADPEESDVRILLATDAASEGIDLHNHCSRVVHYEIPWNPNRLEQRNGRVDRHGQRASEVKIFHFVGKGFDERTQAIEARAGELDADLEFLFRAAKKVEAIREDLGKVGPVIASQVEEAMLGRRAKLETQRAEDEARELRKLVKIERQFREHLEQLRERLVETRTELRLSPEHVHAVVAIGLELAGQPPLREATLEGVWPDRTGRRTRCPVFHLPALRGSWARCAEGLAHPHTGEIRPITFDHEVAARNDRVVLAHLNHRLVAMCLRLLRAEVWSTEGARKLHRVTARVVSDDVLDTPAVVAHGRLVVLGGDQQRLHEEIITAGGEIREGRFQRMGVNQVRAALAAARQEEVAAPVRERLAALWGQHGSALLTALEARMRDRTGGLEKALAERKEKEARDIRAVLEELRAKILAELSDEQPVQLSLEFKPVEKDQFERNREGLRARAERIPAEIETEVESIRARYARAEPRLFPLAVTYLVPARFARG